jgi:hypothetical protein
MATAKKANKNKNNKKHFFLALPNLPIYFITLHACIPFPFTLRFPPSPPSAAVASQKSAHPHTTHPHY